MRSRRFRLALLLALLAAVGGNAVVFAHAWRFTHFVPAGTRTPRPEGMSLADRAWVMLTGVRVTRPVLTRTPEDAGLEAREVALGGVSVWRVEGGGRGTVALFHGYGGVKSDLLTEARAFHDAGFATVLVDFPGSGASAGNVTTLGWNEADVVRDVVTQLHDDRLVLYGKSMGSAAILRAVGVLGVDADLLVLENPFDRLVTTVGHRFEAMGLPAWPGAPLLVFWGGVQLGYDGFAHAPAEYARTVRVPTLLLHGAKDPRVHVDEITAIDAALAGPHHLVLFPEAAHEGLIAADRPRWVEAVNGMLAALPPVAKQE